MCSARAFLGPEVSVFAHPPELYLSPRWSPGAEQTEASFPWACRARLAFPQILLIRGAPPLVDCVPQSDRRLEYSFVLSLAKGSVGKATAKRAPAEADAPKKLPERDGFRLFRCNLENPVGDLEA